MYKQYGWTNTQDKDITVYFPRIKWLMLHINIWTLHKYQLVHFVHSLNIFACLCVIGKESKVVWNMCVIYLSNRIICVVLTKADMTNKISNIGQRTLRTDLRCQILTLPFKHLGWVRFFVFKEILIFIKHGCITLKRWHLYYKSLVFFK